MCRIGSDKTLCEILTVTGAMPLPIAGPRVDCNLSGTVPGGRLFNEEATTSGAGCHGVVAMPPDGGKTDPITQAERQVPHKTMSARIWIYPTAWPLWGPRAPTSRATASGRPSCRRRPRLRPISSLIHSQVTPPPCGRSPELTSSCRALRLFIV